MTSNRSTLRASSKPAKALGSSNADAGKKIKPSSVLARMGGLPKHMIQGDPELSTLRQVQRHQIALHFSN
jgi:hypothetical protein